MSGYSGSPIFPAEDPSRTPRPDAEPTALIPPVPPQAAQPPAGSSFSQIHEKYATTEVPLPPQAFEQPQQQFQQQAYAPQQGFEAPQAFEPQQGLPPQAASADPSWPEHWTQPAQGAPAPPPAWQPQQQGFEPQPQDWSQPPAPAWQPQQPAHAAPPQQPPYTEPQHQPYAAPPQQPGWTDAEQTTLLPPIPPSDYPAPDYPGTPQPGTPAPGYLGTPSYPAPGPGQAGPQAPGSGYPADPSGFPPQPYPAAGPAQSQTPGVEPLAPGATGWSDAPLAYGVPSSLRETFAAAQPTGPAGSYAVPPPTPLEVQPPGGSLREAFAAAVPTGPAAPGYDLPPQAAAPATAAAPAARTGSPIIDPGIQPAAATLALAVLLALAALLGRFGLVVPLLLLQAVTAAGWFRLNGMWPARQGIALAALGGFTADAAALAASGGTAPAVLAGTLGGFFLLVLILQIFRPSNPDERFYALTVSASATVMTVLAGGFLAAETLTHTGWSTGAAVVVGALSAAVATVVSALPMLPARAGFAAGAGAGPVLGALLGALTGVGLGGGLLLGLAAGGCALIGRRVAGYDFPSRFVHLTAGVVLPLACAAPAVFLVAHLLAG